MVCNLFRKPFVLCFCLDRYIRSERSIILINFCLSIISSNILILVGQTQTHNKVWLNSLYTSIAICFYLAEYIYFGKKLLVNINSQRNDSTCFLIFSQTSFWYYSFWIISVLLEQTCVNFQAKKVQTWYIKSTNSDSYGIEVVMGLCYIVFVYLLACWH